MRMGQRKDRERREICKRKGEEMKKSNEREKDSQRKRKRKREKE